MFALTLVLQAQEPGPEIEGRVAQAGSGSPIEGATITLMPPMLSINIQSLQTATTDSNGDFRFDHVMDGTYEIDASADGFVWRTYKQDAGWDHVFQHLNSSTRLRGVDFQLVREAVIRGGVIDAAGKPVVNLIVAAMRQKVPESRPNRPCDAEGVRTDATGQFVLKGLPAGTYLVCVNGIAGYDPVQRPVPNAAGFYRDTWYGGTGSREDAIPIALKEGEERRGLQIIAEPERHFRVIVWPSGPKGEPAPDWYDVRIEGQNDGYMLPADRSYTIADIRPGHYTLVSTALSRSRPVGQGVKCFDVVDADVILHVRLGGSGEIAGKVDWADAHVAFPANDLIMLTSEEGAGQEVPIDAKGHFDLSGVLPGDYVFRPFLGKPIVVPQRVLCGGKKVDDGSPLRVGDREKVLNCEVTLASH